MWLFTNASILEQIMYRKLPSKSIWFHQLQWIMDKYICNKIRPILFTCLHPRLYVFTTWQPIDTKQTADQHDNLGYPTYISMKMAYFISNR